MADDSGKINIVNENARGGGWFKFLLGLLFGAVILFVLFYFFNPLGQGCDKGVVYKGSNGVLTIPSGNIGQVTTFTDDKGNDILPDLKASA